MRTVARFGSPLGAGSSKKQVIDGAADPLGDVVLGGRRIEHPEPARLVPTAIARKPFRTRRWNARSKPVSNRVWSSGALRARPISTGRSSRSVRSGWRPPVAISSRSREVVEMQAAAVALVRPGRVGEPGADDGRAAGERRLDDLLDELAAGRVEQQRVREGIDRRRGRGEEELPDPLAEGGPAGLARPADGNPAGAQRRLEARRLDRLAGAFGPFDRDESTATGRRDRVGHGPSVRCRRWIARSGGRSVGPPSAPPAGAVVRAVIRRGAPGVPSPTWDVAPVSACSPSPWPSRPGLLLPASALAHPLGNFTINHYAGLTIAADHIELDVVIDMAEIPTFQERQAMDADGDGSVADEEAAAYAGRACATLAGDLRLSRGSGASLDLVPGATSIAFPAGAGGLSTLRLECALPGRAVAAARQRAGHAHFADSSYAERIGWREIVATGPGLIVDTHGLPATSPSAKLTAYPADLIRTPLDIRSATIDARLDPAAPPATASAGPADDGPAGCRRPRRLGRARSRRGGARWGRRRAARHLPDRGSDADRDPGVPPHRGPDRGGPRAHAGPRQDAHGGLSRRVARDGGPRGRASGLSVAVSHTLGIFALALIIVGAGSVLPPDVVYRVTPVIAGASIVAIGGWMLLSEVRRRRRAATARGSCRRATGTTHARARARARRAPTHDDPDAHEHGHDHAAAHAHAAPEPEAETATEHSHGGVRHSHLPPAGTTLTWRGLFVLGPRRRADPVDVGAPDPPRLDRRRAAGVRAGPRRRVRARHGGRDDRRRARDDRRPRPGSTGCRAARASAASRRSRRWSPRSPC